MKLTIAHSPDADDAFMFYASTTGKIDLREYELEHVLTDIQTLSDKAINQQAYDLTAISYHSLPKVSEHYELMSAGSSMGDNYGPIIIVKKGSNVSLEDISAGRVRIAVPGYLTSSYLALKIWSDSVQTIEADFNEIQDMVRSGEVDAGLIIHEGQVTMQASEEFDILLDLGQWWYQETKGLLLPLGCNVIRKGLSDKVKSDLTAILSESIQYALDHREEAIEFALQYGRGLPQEEADKFIGMYVNEYTVDLGQHGRDSVNEFYSRAGIELRV